MGTGTPKKNPPSPQIHNYSSPFSTYSVYMAGFLTKNWWKNEILNPPCLGNNSACDNP
jgi:hypothetical protein